jgi:tRNA A-37 threonylcarbamoyl transferase component Bud32
MGNQMNGEQPGHDRRGLSAAATELPDEAGSFLDVVLDATSGSEWRVGTAPNDAPVWIYVERDPAPSVDRGWKLHVSAALPHALDVLERALEVLLRGETSFKVAASMRVLESLNEGDAGPGQIGKFMTIYPETDEVSVRLATELHKATEGLRGPPVLSDRPLQPGSLVHYRYGHFSEPVEGESTGRTTDELAARPFYTPPPDVGDPFLNANVSPPDNKGLIASRYFVSSTLHRSARGAVHVGVDMQKVEECILKRAWRDARLTPDGVDARDQLRDEAEKLRRIEGRGPWPRVIDLVDDRTDLILVLERVPGVSLAAAVHRLFDERRPPDIPRMAGWGTRLAGALATVHDAGLVYRDLNPENVIVGRSEKLSLVDFELAQEPGPVSEFYVAGTPGFISPRQAAGEAATFSDDAYAFGALLAFMAIGERPPQGAAAAEAMRERLGSRSDGDAVDALVRIAQDCLDAEVDVGAEFMTSIEKRLGAIA